VIQKLQEILGEYKIERANAEDVHMAIDYIENCGPAADCDWRIDRVVIGGDTRTPPTTWYLVHMWTINGDDVVFISSPDGMWVAVPK